ncbi:MAG: DEAD/DEAH box helicase [Gammaproteobacteria bacterium]|nr:DEAD/DEAH box helicase [Gammaproteobacteria bacterium]MDH5691675.1 DEAD/DEAH box helicase [Gammaproteobacteria bacterium]
MSTNHLTTSRFSELAINPKILSALDKAGFTYCTPIQAQALPKALSGTNLIGKARTGSGKTFAFLIATINTLLNNTSKAGKEKGASSPVRALILAPTRELALQIERETQILASDLDLKIALAYGGADYEKQRNHLKNGADILIGTPGRIIDYYKQRVFSLNEIEVLVLDESDRMLDLGFIKDIRFLLRRMPPADNRLNLLFSATLSYRVIELAYEHLGAPVVVSADEEQVSASSIEQIVYYPANSEKIPLLIGLIKRDNPERTIVFLNTKHEADLVSRYLEGNDIHAKVLSGDVPQKKRQKLVLDFEKGDLPVLVATDVAARGLHIPEVSHVVNYDLPQDPEDYVHRIGRTGRIGHKGIAISFVCETYAFSLPEIESYINMKIPRASVDPELLEKPKPPVQSTRKPAHKGNRHPQKTGQASRGSKERGDNSSNRRSRNRKPNNRPKPTGS